MRFCFGRKILISAVVFGAMASLVFIKSAAAASLLLIGQSETKGSLYEATLFVDSGNNAINAVAGTILFPSTMRLEAVKSGDSIINFWVEPPAASSVVTKGNYSRLSFSGVMAGGVSTRAGKIFTLLFKNPEPAVAKSETVVFESAELISADGLATKIPLTTNTLEVAFAKEDAAAPASTSATGFIDTAPPEISVPILTRDKRVLDNQWFVAFVAIDTDSGIDHYEAQETETTAPSPNAWQRVKSPYIVRDQSLGNHIFIRAIDGAGNTRVTEVARPKRGLAAGLYWYFFLAFLISVFIYFVHRFGRRPV